MARFSYRGLKILLLLLCVDATAKGLLMIFGGKNLMMRLFPYPHESEITTLLLLMRQEWGALNLTVALMLYWAYRDPLRNVAILNAIMIGLCIAALVAVSSTYTLDAQRLYPAYSIWGHPAVRLVVAASLYYLRPREAKVLKSFNTAPLGSN